jgi:hypothetical protein
LARRRCWFRLKAALPWSFIRVFSLLLGGSTPPAFKKARMKQRAQGLQLARSGTAQLAEIFGMSDATIYKWLKQEWIDRGESRGLSTEEALDLADVNPDHLAAAGLVRRIHVASCDVDPPAALVPVLERMGAAGIELGDVLADSGYAPPGGGDLGAAAPPPRSPADPRAAPP